jgi:tetratricopeptide (TPR) repeat protein
MAPPLTSFFATASNRLAWLLPLAVLSLPLPTAANPPADTTFAEANRLYEQELYPQAIESYLSLLHQGVHSPALHFNLGNAFFRSDQIGLAILHFRHAQQLRPRDPAIRANLQFARQQVALHPPSSRSLWLRAVLSLTLNEWTTLTLITLWSSLALLTVTQLAPNLRPPVRPAVQALALISLLSAIPLAASWRQFHQPSAIVIAPQSSVRFGPFTESQEHFSLPNGAELVILDQLNDWLQIRDPQGRTGWLPSQQVVRFPTLTKPSTAVSIPS